MIFLHLLAGSILQKYIFHISNVVVWNVVGTEKADQMHVSFPLFVSFQNNELGS